jgi:hypothetical protein
LTPPIAFINGPSIFDISLISLCGGGQQGASEENLGVVIDSTAAEDDDMKTNVFADRRKGTREMVKTW